MVSFRDRRQQASIYVAVVVPLTMVLMIGYMLWLKVMPRIWLGTWYRKDIETGQGAPFNGRLAGQKED